MMNFHDQQSLKTLLTQPHPNNNIPIQVIEKIGRNLHTIPDHPLGIIKQK
jgi:hypothetical protein